MRPERPCALPAVLPPVCRDSGTRGEDAGDRGDRGERGEYSPSAWDTERGESSWVTLPGVVRRDVDATPLRAPLVLLAGALAIAPSLPTTMVMRGLDDDVWLLGEPCDDDAADIRRIERADGARWPDTAAPASPSPTSRLEALEVKLGRWGMRDDARRAAAMDCADGAGRGGFEARANTRPDPDWSGEGGISSSGVDRANQPLRRRRMNSPRGTRVSELVRASACVYGAR